MTINVFILAAIPVTTARIKSFLRSRKYITVTGFSSDPFEAMNFMQSNPSAILIIDDAFFSKASIEQFIYVKPSIKVVFYTGSTNAAYLNELLEMSIKGIVHKKSKRALLAEAVKKLSENENYIDKKIKIILAR